MNENFRLVNNKNAVDRNFYLPEMNQMYRKRNKSAWGTGMWLLIGMAAGAAGCCGVCGLPRGRKVKRRLMHAADAVNDALDNLYSMMK